MLYWAQVNDEFANNWQNLKESKKKPLQHFEICRSLGQAKSVSQQNNTTVLSNHEIRSKLKSISLQENVQPAYSQQSHTNIP